MSNVYRFGPDEDRSVQASAWIARMDKGLSAADTQALKDWLLADRRNESELLSMAQMWDKMDALSQLSEVFPHSAEVGESNAPGHRWWASATIGVALIAVTAVLIMEVALFRPERDQAFDADAYETAIGGISEIRLTDGSRIALNSHSSIEVAFSDHHRLIALKRGEIHVDAAHDPARLLTVIAGERIVRAVGTAFSVRIDERQRVEVLVVDGRVRVGMRTRPIRNDDDWSSTASAEPGGPSLLIAQGERSSFDASTETLEVLDSEEIEVRLSWREGNLVFRGESLAEAARRVGRYTPMEFVILDERLRTKRVAGLFKVGDVTGFLSSLEANLGVTHERLDDQTILLSTQTAERLPKQEETPR